MIGVEVPKPGIFSFHFTFSVSLHFTGGSASGATPFARGPRQRGQFALAESAFAAAKVTAEKIEARAARKRAVRFMRRVWPIARERKAQGKRAKPFRFAGLF
jgi:hypothetical protein